MPLHRLVPHDTFDQLRRHGGIAWHDERPVAGMMGDNPLLPFINGTRTCRCSSERARPNTRGRVGSSSTPLERRDHVFAEFGERVRGAKSQNHV